MSWFRERLLQWKEPPAFRREREIQETAKLRWWHRPTAVLLTMLVLWSSGLNKRLDHSGEWMSLVPSLDRLAVVIVGAFFFVYGVPWLMRWVPAYISVYTEGIGRAHGNQGYYLKFAEVASFTWESWEGFRVLTLVRRKDGREIQYGVPSNIPSGTIQEALLRHGAIPLPARTRVATRGGTFAERPAGV